MASGSVMHQTNDSCNNLSSCKSFVFFDTETTGLPISGHEPKIAQMTLFAVEPRNFLQAASSYNNNNNATNPPMIPQLIDKLTMTFDVTKPFTPFAARVNGLSQSMLCGRRPFDAAVVRMLELFLDRQQQPTCLIAYNGMAYDFKLLRAEIEHANGEINQPRACSGRSPAIARRDRSNTPSKAGGGDSCRKLRESFRQTAVFERLFSMLWAERLKPSLDSLQEHDSIWARVYVADSLKAVRLMSKQEGGVLMSPVRRGGRGRGTAFDGSDAVDNEADIATTRASGGGDSSVINVDSIESALIASVERQLAIAGDSPRGDGNGRDAKTTTTKSAGAKFYNGVPGNELPVSGVADAQKITTPTKTAATRSPAIGRRDPPTTPVRWTGAVGDRVQVFTPTARSSFSAVGGRSQTPTKGGAGVDRAHRFTPPTTPRSPAIARRDRSNTPSKAGGGDSGRKPRESFRQTAVFERLFGVEPPSAHDSEGDVVAMLQICMAFGARFVDYVHANAVPFSDVKRMWPK